MRNREQHRDLQHVLYDVGSDESDLGFAIFATDDLTYLYKHILMILITVFFLIWVNRESIRNDGSIHAIGKSSPAIAPR